MSDVNKKVFITGAAGFIGKSLMARYRAMGWTAVGIDFNADPEQGIFCGNLLQPAGWSEHLKDCDLVIHTAALVSNTANWDQAWEVNVKGTRQVLDAAIAAGVNRFLHLSSVAAYGFYFEGCVSEEAPLKPIGNVYVDSKIASEHAVLQAHASGSIDCTIIRPTDVYGPGSRPWVIIPVESIRDNKFILPAYGQGRFSPVYIDNLIDGMVLAAEHEEGKGQIFNIGDGVDLTASEFFAHYYQFLGILKPVKTMSLSLAKGLSYVIQLVAKLTGKASEIGPGTMDMLSRTGSYDISKARQLIGYQPHIDLDAGMERTRVWLVEQGYFQ
ncbi:NAD(P)-dependent oxidoreductase [Maricurvus nonylphenolicus]|uniref:NAD-dependent epimerase/dehydratase family protein n=1 Tax=Maricurvus nonylphenolicus TaxID=1008307 RepID=UPI0036F2BD71